MYFDKVDLFIIGFLGFLGGFSLGAILCLLTS
jgi:hypothetical protein